MRAGGVVVLLVAIAIVEAVAVDGHVGVGRDQLLAVGYGVAATALGVVRSAAAAGKHPEEAGGQGEQGTDPDGAEEARVEAAVHAIELGGALDGATTIAAVAVARAAKPHTATVATAEIRKVMQEKTRLQLASRPKKSSTPRATQAMMKTISVQRTTVTKVLRPSVISDGRVTFLPVAVIRPLTLLVVLLSASCAQLNAGFVHLECRCRLCSSSPRG